MKKKNKYGNYLDKKTCTVDKGDIKAIILTTLAGIVTLGIYAFFA